MVVCPLDEVWFYGRVLCIQFREISKCLRMARGTTYFCRRWRPLHLSGWSNGWGLGLWTCGRYERSFRLELGEERVDPQAITARVAPGG